MNLNISHDWKSVVYRGIESEEIDYKAAQNWTKLKRSGKAKFVRHCLALANTKGGYIVVGVGENKAGKPVEYTGLTEEESHSFDPSIIGSFINNYTDPAIDFTIERPIVEEKRYVIFVVRRFNDIPHVCSSHCEDELQQGGFYIRTAEAASRLAFRASEVHALIQRSLRNQRQTLGRMLRGILYENDDVNFKDSDNLFKEQRIATRELLLRKKNISVKENNRICFELTVSPAKFQERRFTVSEIKRALDEALVFYPDANFINGDDLRNSFFTNTAIRMISNRHAKGWQAFKSGYFHYISYFHDGVKSLKYQHLIKFFTAAVYFISEYYTILGFDTEELNITVKYHNIENIALGGIGKVKQNSEENIYSCKIPEIDVKMQRTAPDLDSGIVQHAARIIRDVCERFNLPDGKHINLEENIKNFLEKR
ncbi:ATP-binding protein [Lentisphaerota bacterium WC36G]|nr:ATP-binding protein [Lentisphaerae bacterium WC36]